MPLSAGTQLGQYQIVRALGAGGMGEVYLADDTRLRRRIALKVLPAGTASNAQAAERLLREARAAAGLDHPNICTVYDTGEIDGQSFIAMQFVDGESLDGRLARKPLDLRDAVAIAGQAAQALAVAHQQGIVHRDVKPQNIMVTPSGQAKVLDFGLAQTIALLGDGKSTEAQLTEAGVVPGTVRYMSPEQLRGDGLDERTDLFSLGVVMFEMIGGTHPFGAGSVPETMAAILMRDPPPLRDDVPAELRRIVFKCLEKDRGRRYQTARDLAVDLDALGRESASSPAAVSGLSPAPAVPRAGRAGWIAAGVAAAAAIGVALWATLGRPASSSTPSVAEYVQITDFADSATAPALSADGTMVVFIRSGNQFLSAGQIYVKRLPNGEAKQLTSDPRLKYDPRFTADGNRVTYTTIDPSGWNTWSVPVIGGDISHVLPNSAGLTWIDDRRILFSEIKGRGVHMGVVTSTPTRAEHRVLYFPPHERAMAHYSAISPDRKWVLVVEMSRTGGWDPCRVVPFESGAVPRVVGPPAPCTAAAWSPDGQWMYFTASEGATSHIWRQRFPNGMPEALTSGSATDEQGLAIEPGGKSLITSLGRPSSALWFHDSAGERLLSSEGFASAPVMTRDGKRVFFLLRRVDSPEFQLAVVDVLTGRTEMVLPDVSLSHFALSTDEKSVAYVTSGGRQVALAALDKSSPPRIIVENADSVRFGPDDDLFFRSVEGQANFLDRVKRDGSGRRRVLDRPIIQIIGATPDGQWVIVHTPPTADAQMVTDVLAIPIAGGEPRKVCETYCRFVSWSADGRTLFLGDFDTLAVPLPPGRWFPEFPADGSPGLGAWANLKGVRRIDSMSVASADSSSYVFVKREDLRNLFRIPIK